MSDEREIFLGEGDIIIKYCGGRNDRFIFGGDGGSIGTGSVLNELLTKNRKEQFDNKNFSVGFTFDELVLTLQYLGERMKLPFSIALWLAKQQNKTKEVN